MILIYEAKVKMFKQLVVLCAIATAVLCRHAPSNMNALYSEQTSEKTMGSDDKGDDTYMANWDISSIYNSIKNYTNSDISVYLKMKLLSGIDSATRGDLDLGAGVRLVRDKDVSDDNDANLNTELRSMPRGLGDREDYLTSMIWKKFNRLLRTHTMQVSKLWGKAGEVLGDFGNYLLQYELPQFVLDVVDYKLDKWRFLYRQSDDNDKKRKKNRKRKKQKKRKRKKQKKKRPQYTQTYADDEHYYVSYDTYNNNNKNKRPKRPKPKKPKKKKKKPGQQGDVDQIHIHVSNDAYGHDDQHHYQHHSDDDDDYEYRLPYPMNYLED